MPTLSSPQDAHQLMQVLEKKIKLLISQGLVTRLEIAQLKQQNALLMTQLGEQDRPTEKPIHP